MRKLMFALTAAAAIACAVPANAQTYYYATPFATERHGHRSIVEFTGDMWRNGMQGQPVVQLATHSGVGTGQQYRHLTEQFRETLFVALHQRVRAKTA